MFSQLIKRIFGTRNERTLKRMMQTVQLINAQEPFMQSLTNAAFHEKIKDYKERYKNGESLDSLLPETFALVREASVRTLQLRHFDVQLIGGMVLHEGNIAEMRTGEGKTLMSTLPICLNALTGDGVHVVTVNDYLAQRDSEWMKPIYDLLGLSVAVIHPEMTKEDKQKAYKADIVYGTNNEFGFDYLRDNMAFTAEERVQQRDGRNASALNFAIVDEVDSILIDEARTPLIISGAAEGSSEWYLHINKIIPHLNPADYTLDEKQRQAHLTEEGHEHIEQILVDKGLLGAHDSLYHPSNIMILHHINAALKAYHLFHKDVDYIVKDKQIVIVDEHTGRTMSGRRWSEGLHQAIEAKEGLSIQYENQTLASITFQNYFRLYNKLSGMTGTADTEAYEFQQIYGLEVVAIPTNKPMHRTDEADLIYLTQEDKYRAIIDDIKDCIARDQPVLVGTVSIEASELLSSLLKKEGLKHQVLNAKFHEKEAHIIAEAGRPGVVTIATNMAGRGTDIVLGGNLTAMLAALGPEASEKEKENVKKLFQKSHEKVLAAGGLRIIGSERHESRRIDNQLRGRAGRQGDPGSSRFYLSLEDHLMRIFASDKVANLMRRLGMKPGEPIEHSLVSRAIENAQRKLEGHHFDVRKQLLEYDNVADSQRKVIYARRLAIMSIASPEPLVAEMRQEVVSTLVKTFIPPQSLEDQWDVNGLMDTLQQDFNLKADIASWIEQDHHIQPEDIEQRLQTMLHEKYAEKETRFGRELMDQFEKSVILQTIDSHWREHLSAMDYLRQGIHLRGYAQKDPKQEYKREAFALFTNLLETIKYEIVRLLTIVEIETSSDIDLLEQNRRTEEKNQHYVHAHLPSEEELNTGAKDNENMVTFRRAEQKIGRNTLCPCHSGKKYKSCHGQLS